MGFIKNFVSLPKRTKSLLGLGAIIALTLALPLFIWGLLSQRFEIREKASVYPTCVPRPRCLDAKPRPCNIPEPDRGWCAPTPSATAKASSSATSTATATATSTATATATSSSTTPPIGGVTTTTPQATPNYCGGTCGSKYNCQDGLFCFEGFCRNPVCKSDTDCDCVTPTPKATVKPTGSKSPSPTPIATIIKLTPFPTLTARATATSSPTPIAQVTEKKNLNYLLYIAGGAFGLAILLAIAKATFKK